MAYRMHENRSVLKYLESIGKIPLIKAEKEIELAKKIKNGNNKALNELVTANLRFVVTVARRYQNRGLPFEDLIAEGNHGLIEAAKRFDGKKGFKFISYAIWWIRQAIQQAIIKQTNVVKLPSDKNFFLDKVKKTRSILEQKNQKNPSILEISEELGIDSKEVEDIYLKTRKQHSLDEETKDTDNLRLLNFIEQDTFSNADDVFTTYDLREQIEEKLATLKKREAEIIRLYYGIGREKPYTLVEIGNMYGYTRERIRQIKKKALHRLRHISRSRDLQLYVN